MARLVDPDGATLWDFASEGVDSFTMAEGDRSGRLDRSGGLSPQ